MRPLAHDTPHSLSDGATRWPVIAGIPFLRLGRERLRAELVKALDHGDETAALLLALADQDDFAPLPPPSDDALRNLLAEPEPRFRDAMAALNFGPVADYFAHRWSTPTYLSGAALIALYAPLGRPLLEVACGTGQLLREFALRGGRTVGTDQVFAKLWLGNRFFGLAHLVCADAQSLPLEVTEGATALIHDALYFIANAEKPLVLAAMLRAASGGAVLAGHCHVAHHPHAGDRAHPLTVEEWRSLMPDAALFDDAALTDWFVTEGRASPRPLDRQHNGGNVGPAAVALAGGPQLAQPLPVWQPPPTKLFANPLLEPGEGGGLVPCWPSEAFAREYADADYLNVDDPTLHADLPVATRHARRLLVPLPDRW